MLMELMGYVKGHGGPRAAHRRGQRTTPLASKLARAHGLDLTSTVGSGISGRVNRRDVELLLGARMTIENHQSSARAVPSMSSNSPQPATLAQPAPVAWMLTEVDFTAIARTALPHSTGTNPTARVMPAYLPYLLRAVILALRQFPLLNATWEGQAIRQHGSIHLALADLTIPASRPLLIAQADQFDFGGLARAIAQAQREPGGGTLTSARGIIPTFTLYLTTAGDGARMLAQGGLPDGRAASLTLGPPVRRAVVRGQTIGFGDVSWLGVSFDHRVVDGAPVGQFLQAVRTWLETYAPQEPVT